MRASCAAIVLSVCLGLGPAPALTADIPFPFGGLEAQENAESFELARTDCARRALVPTRTCSLEVLFRPVAPGPASGRVEAQTSAGVLPALVLLGGTGETR